MVKPFKGQDFYQIRKSHLDQGTLFTDPEFPPSNQSLFHGKNNLIGKIQWKRPGEICSEPKLFEAGISSGDVFQGKLGNCWFVAACSALAGVKQLWNKVIPDYKDQEWDSKNKYAGIFHFQFWRFGEWIDVVIDDFLPTVNGRLIFTHSQSKREFWCALLEKAFAKINGCYESLDKGNLSDALMDFTGGISETIDIKGGKYYSDEQKSKELFKMMLKQKDNHALMCCAIGAKTKAEMEAKTSVGLVIGHAYGITAVRKVNLKGTSLLVFLKRGGKSETINMIRCRNPWGEYEWNGPFSDGSPEWQRISSAEREKLGLTFEEDGEFWMPFDEFVKHFSEVSICHLLNTSFFTFSRRWYCPSPVYGNWTTGPRGSSSDRAGGCANNKNTFFMNPQYSFDIDSEGAEVIIELSQPDSREKRHEGAENLAIGFHVFKVEVNREYRLHSLFEVVGNSDFINSRSVVLRKTIDTGRYVLLPATFKPGQAGSFLLRFFATCNVKLSELTRDAPKPSSWCCITNPSWVTTVTVRKVTGLAKNDSIRSLDLYCIITCEGKAVRSFVVNNAQQEASWDLSGIFYRKKSNQPITVEIWNRNVAIDTLLAHAKVEISKSDGRKIATVPLKGKRGKETIPGRLVVEYETSDDFLKL